MWASCSLRQCFNMRWMLFTLPPALIDTGVTMDSVLIQLRPTLSGTEIIVFNPASERILQFCLCLTAVTGYTLWHVLLYIVSD